MSGAASRQVARVNGAISDAEMTDLDAEMARASSGGAAAGEEPPTAPPTEPHTEPRPPRAEAPSAPSGALGPRALSPRAPSVHQLLEQLSAAPTPSDTSKGDSAAAESDGEGERAKARSERRNYVNEWKRAASSRPA